MSPHTGWSRAALLALAFLAGGAVMVLELAAPRLVAADLGTTLLTWTVVVATFLGGIATGNAWGGRWADGGRSLLLPLLFLAAGLAAAAAPPLYRAAAALTRAWSLEVRTLAVVPVAFLPVAVALGALSPALARALLGGASRPGRALGAVAAAGAAGSVIGTFAAGYLLVPRLGLRGLFLTTAALLALVGLGLLPSRRRLVHDPRPRTPSARPPRGWAALAVLAGGALLVLEIAAAREASDRLGNSIYTWTAVIGAVLVGLAAGSALGGRLADRHEARGLLGRLLLLASAAVAATAWAPLLVEPATALPLSWPLGCLVAGAALVLLPSVAIGTLTPVIVRAALEDPGVDGRVVGRLYALGTLGAVTGALLTGYVLVPLLGVTVLMLFLALLLAAGAAHVRRRWPLGWTTLLLVAALLARLPGDSVRTWGLDLGLREDEPGLYVADSRYYRIRVAASQKRSVSLAREPDAFFIHGSGLFQDESGEEVIWYDPKRGRLMWWDGPMTRQQRAYLERTMRDRGDREAVERLYRSTHQEVRILTLDRLIHGYANLDDPRWLGYEYELLYAALVETMWPRREGGEPARALFIGGGAYSFQRWLLGRPGGDVRAVSVEIDPEVTEAARAVLGLREDDRHTIVHEDARTYVERLAEGEGDFDFVFGDAFNDLAVPFHLTTREFAETLEARMAPGGVYLVNVVDVMESGRFVGAFMVTLEQVFDHVALASMEPREDTARETFVLMASNRPLRLDDLEDERGLPLRAVVYEEADLQALRERAGHLVLTDDRAPVEILLAPVVRARGAAGRAN